MWYWELVSVWYDFVETIPPKIYVIVKEVVLQSPSRYSQFCSLVPTTVTLNIMVLMMLSFFVIVALNVQI